MIIGVWWLQLSPDTADWANSGCGRVAGTQWAMWHTIEGFNSQAVTATLMDLFNPDGPFQANPLFGHFRFKKKNLPRAIKDCQ